jgi:hypothetical protein
MTTKHLYPMPPGHAIKSIQAYGFILLFIISTVLFADATGIVLPDSYRTPLSDMVPDSQTDWRAKPEEDNPWRQQEEELIIKPRLKTEFFPKPDYSKDDDPTSRSLLQNEFELERPRTNIFKYNF